MLVLRDLNKPWCSAMAVWRNYA